MTANTRNDLLKHVKKFYSLQAERVETYALFEEGFLAYLKGAPNYNLEMYKLLVNEITTTFQKISKDILDIEEILVKNQRNELADSVRKIQELEQNKLQHTAELQMTRQKEKDEPNVDLTESLAVLHSKLSKITEEIVDEMETLKYSAEDLYVGSGDDT